jgi:hypothetical protein
MIERSPAIIAWKLPLYGVDPRGTTTLTSGGGGTAKYAGRPEGDPADDLRPPRRRQHRCPGGQYGYARLDPRSVVGADWSLWRVPAKSGTTGAAGPWTGGGDFTTHGPGTANPSPWNWSPKAMSTGGPDNRVVLVDPTSSWTYDLGGSLTSVAAVARQSDGAVIVYARGGDGALWSIRYRYPSDRGSWTSLGGSIR